MCRTGAGSAGRGAEEDGCGGDYALGRGLWHNDTVTLRFGGALSRSLGRGTERAGAVVPTRRAHCLHPKFLGETTPVAVKIKLKRMGKIHAPFYRIIVADARTKRDGRAIEEIGKYHPKNEPSLIEVNSERAQHWLSVGAQPTDPVRKILEITGDWQKFKGLPGTEGTLRSAAPKADKKDAFAAAVAETLGDAGKGKGSGPAKAGAGKPAAKAGGKQPAAKADTAKADTAKADTAKADTAKADTAKADTAKAATAGTATAGTATAGTATAGTATAGTVTADTATADTATADADTADADTADSTKAGAGTAEPPADATAEPAAAAAAQGDGS